MLMKNNFIHADCHGGNLFIEIKQQSYNFFTEVWDFFHDLIYVLSIRLKAETMDSESLKQLYL
jgi:predicted unusual protein kinase regulating ubiquinone biosynthesis (AarF/ABC1/UbiB family)